MTKADFVQSIYDTVKFHHASFTKAMAEETYRAFCKAIKHEMMHGEGRAPLTGLGVISVKQRAGRTGRNPMTGEQVDIPARKKIVFTESREFKQELNK